MATTPKAQMVRYAFYKLAPEWWRLPAEERRAAGSELIDLVGRWRECMMISPFSTAGTRGDTDFMLWQASARLDDIHGFAADLQRSRLGAWTTQPYSYLAMTRRSIYVANHTHEGQEGTRLRLMPGGAKYLFVYPFVKTRPWYALPINDRQRMMDEHIRIGHEYPSVSLNTTYSFGLDDQEFVLAFESDEVGDFLDLVMRLRESEASMYTLRDTPIFTCLSTPIERLTGLIGAE
ncbi:MAG: chlorite dismutase family protein [Dehalococcoidia bacterium]